MVVVVGGGAEEEALLNCRVIFGVWGRRTKWREARKYRGYGGILRNARNFSAVRKFARGALMAI